MNKDDLKKLRGRIGSELFLDSSTALELVALAEEALVIREREAALVNDSRFQPWRKFIPDAEGAPHGWIQWKGTDVCLDFHCKCGAHGHVDAEFAYYVKCAACGQVYEMSGYVEAHPTDETPPNDACVARLS